MPSVEDAASERFVEARFTCSRCGGEAAHLTLLPQGVTGPGATSRDLFSGLGHRLVIDAGSLSTTIGAPGVLDAPAFAQTLAGADAAAIFAVDREFAPFWCPRCSAVYCGAEWRTWNVWEDDTPGWWEELRGTCPAGHERMIYD